MMVYLRSLSEGRFCGLISYSVPSIPAWLHHNIAISTGTAKIITAAAKLVMFEASRTTIVFIASADT